MVGGGDDDWGRGAGSEATGIRFDPFLSFFLSLFMLLTSAPDFAAVARVVTSPDASRSGAVLIFFTDSNLVATAGGVGSNGSDPQIVANTFVVIRPGFANLGASLIPNLGTLFYNSRASLIAGGTCRIVWGKLDRPGSCHFSWAGWSDQGRFVVHFVGLCLCVPACLCWECNCTSFSAVCFYGGLGELGTIF
jgi:hypothetical protein